MLNIVIPMAGKGSRFTERGYTFPKPLIEVGGKPMIQLVVENLKPKKIDHRFIFIVRKEHYEKYELKVLLERIAPGCIILPIDLVTQGASCTVLLANEYINNEDSLLIANSDQYVDFDFEEYLDFSENGENDGTILTFPSNHPKWSYVRLNEDKNAIEVAEKKPISNKATVGIYYFKKGKTFCDGVMNMIRKNIRVNGEFYVCPVYNEIILENKKIKVYDIKKEQMWGIGTPEDLELFFKSKIIDKI